MRRHLAVIVLGAAGLSGCFHVTVITGAPASTTVIDKPWQLSFAAGLVPPPVLNVKTDCPQGVAKIETENSFLNMLAGGVTSSIITPMHATVTCASGPVAK
ncbi:MAG: hypothetical protein ABI625_06245 [bacterium]